MTIGLDIDDRFTVVAREGTDPTTERTSFVELPDEEMVLDMLSSGDVEYVQHDGAVYAVGNAAIDFAGMFDAPVESLLRGGILTGERDVDAMLTELLLEQVLGRSEDGALAGYAVPAEPADAELDTLFHRRTIDDRLATLGYEPASVTRGVAAGYAGFVGDTPSGLAIVLGAETSEICLLDDGQPVVEVGLGRGGGWIDRQVAGATDREPDAIADERDTYDLTGGDGDVLGMYAGNFLSYIVDAVGEHVAPEVDGTSLPVVIAGSAARSGGIRERLDSLLAEAAPSVAVEEVRVLSDPVTAVARGAPLAATADHATTEPHTGVGSTGERGVSTGSTGEASTEPDTDDSATSGDDAAEPPDHTAAIDELDRRLSELHERVDGTVEREALAELEESIATLESRLSELADGTLGALSSELDTVGAEVDGLREQLDTLGQRQHSLDDRLEDTPDSQLSDSVADLKDELSGLRDEVDGMQSQLAELETAATTADEDLRDRLTDVETTLEAREGLQSQVETAERTIAATAEELDTAVDRIDGIEAELDDVATGIEALETSLEDTEATAERTRDRLSETESRIDELERTTSSTADRVDDQGDRIGTVESTTTAVDERIEALEQSVGAVDVLSESLDEIDERLSSLQSSVAATDDRIAKLEALDERVEDVESTLERVERSERTLDEKQSRHEDAVDVVRSDLEDLQSQVASLHDRDDGPDEDEVRSLATTVARERVLAPAAGGAAAFGLLAAGGAAMADVPVLAGVFAIVAVACLGVFLRVR